jgi:hypothetical protein
MSYTLIAANQGMSQGLVYKFFFKAINEIGASDNSVTVKYALVDVPQAPGTPVVMLAFTNKN